MQRMTAIILALMLACLSAVGFAEDVRIDVQGKWYLDVLKTGEYEMKAAAIGMDIWMDFGADGNVTMSAEGAIAEGMEDETQVAPYTVEGNIVRIAETEEGEAESFTYEDGKLILGSSVDEETSFEMIFVREADRSQVEAPALVAAKAVEDFDGDWKLTKMAISGMEFSAEDMDDEPTIWVIRNGLLKDGDSENSNGIELVFENGSCILVQDGITSTLYLNEEGNLVLDLSELASGSYYFFERVEEAVEVPAA